MGGVGGGVSGGLSTSRPTSIRSLASSPRNSASLGGATHGLAAHPLSKSSSTPQLPKMATATALAPAVQQPTSRFRTDAEALNTIPDPRSPPPSSGSSRNASAESVQHYRHPDLSNEVAMLSNKLINAINQQTNLDDNLQSTRHELDAALTRIAELEKINRAHTSAMEQGMLVRKEDVVNTETSLRSELASLKIDLAEERKQKKRIESEVENLTTALFEEANTMVAAARKETEASERRIEQLKSQLHDTEVLLASQQEQLQDLKGVMEKMSSERDDNETNTHNSTAPSTPGLSAQDKLSRIFESQSISPTTPGSDEIPPNHPLHFTHLVQPVLRNDLQAYTDFKELAKAARSAAPSRAGSGNFGGLNIMGLGSHSNASTSSIPSVSPATPSGPVNSSTSGPSPSLPSPAASCFLPPLKDTRFYKRAVVEDIEPTLRLDSAPGLNWLARRSIVSSLAAGQLMVEPHPPIPRFHGPVFACALCGEHRRGDRYQRRFRFRASDADDAQRYPLCDYCLGRLRTSCDYVGFLRMVKDGHWRAEGDDEVHTAYEESVRLRERMFWARLGGGVVPSLVVREVPPSPSMPPPPVPPRQQGGDDGQVLKKKRDGAAEDPFGSAKAEKRVSIGKAVIERLEDESEHARGEEAAARIDEAAARQLREEHARSSEERSEGTQKSAEVVATPDSENDIESKMESGTTDTVVESPPEAQEYEKQRISLTIPGAFD